MILDIFKIMAWMANTNIYPREIIHTLELLNINKKNILKFLKKEEFQ